MSATVANTAAVRVAETLSDRIALILGERGEMAFAMHPSIYAGENGDHDLTGRPSLTRKVPVVQWGGIQPLVAVAENADVTISTLTHSSIQLTAAKFMKQYGTSAEAALWSLSAISDNPQRAAEDLVASRDHSLTLLIAALASGWGTEVGGTGVSMSLDLFIDCQQALDAQHFGALPDGTSMCQMTSVQYHSFQNSLRSETSNAFSWQQATADMLRLRGGNYKGRFNGTDIFVVNGLPTTGPDVHAQFLGPRAIYRGWANPQPNQAATATVFDGMCLEFSRNSDNGQNKTTETAFLAASRGQANSGVKCLTSAT